MPVKKSLLINLKKEIPFHYKPQVCNEREAVMVGYVDNRDVQDVLDDTVGPENWSIDYHILKDQMFARLGIYVDFEDGTPPQWVYKCDTGTEANMEEEKSQVSDSMKRAAVQWGCGRFLYRLGMAKLPTKEYKGKWKPATHDGRILWTNDEISEYIRNGGVTKGTEKKEAKKPNTEKYQTPTSEPTYTKAEYSDATVKRVTSLKHGELKGKDCLKQFIPDYNKKFGTEYKNVVDFNNDELINKLMDFITSLPPKGI